MASKIRVLTEDTINKIAAGEVIENPASVVKELVENSIDAGSTEIIIEIQGGGRQLIRISDNGCGMNRDDALLCLERHATSKIRSVDDLEGVLTMGFRGEAIPSIASISKFTLLTCPSENTKGSLVIVDGGKLLTATEAVRGPGTTIEVKNLFFNVPVRKKFMKSPAVDTNEVTKMATQIALGNQQMKFQLIVDGKTEMHTSRPKSELFQESLKSRINDLLGQEFSENTRYFEHKTSEFTLQGYLGNPLFNRHNRTGQWLFINGRGIFSPIIASAIKDGYSTCLPTGRYPVFVLHLQVNGELVDVNVHPQKREVRLRQEQYFREEIGRAVQGCLNHSVESISFSTAISPVFAEAIRAPISFEEPPPQWRFSEPAKFVPAPPARVELPKMEYREERVPQKPVETRLSIEDVPRMHISTRILATIPGYLLVEGMGNGITMVDQNAAHCRVLYERLSAALRHEPLVLQTLLVPQTIELLPQEATELRKMLPQLNAIGLQMREFGPRSFIVEAISEFLSQENLETLIADILASGFESEALTDAKLSLETAKRLSIAIHRRAVSTKKCLTHIEAKGLLEQLQRCQNSNICPQGRPICAPLSPEDVAKFFQQHAGVT